MEQRVGHLDFFPNGGRDNPGCDPVNIPIDMITEDMVTGGRELVACNHLRSIEFFIDSLVPGLTYVGYECPDNDAFHRVRKHVFSIYFPTNKRYLHFERVNATRVGRTI